MPVGLATVLIALACAGCATGGGDPVGRYDFRYSASGDRTIRPYQVFDDGQSTWLQFTDAPSSDLHIAVVAASGRIDQPVERRGALIVIPSVADALAVSVDGQDAQVRYQGPARPAHIAVRADTPSSPSSGTTTTTSAPITDNVTVVPIPPVNIRSATAAGSIPAPATPSIPKGSAPATTGLTDVPAAAGLPLPGTNGRQSAPASASTVSAAPSAQTSPTGSSALARVFHAQAIRTRGAGPDERIQIRFAAARPPLTFTTPDGRPLAVQWDPDGFIVTFDAVPVFLVSDHVTTIQVRREPPDYRFDPSNAAHLTRVFDQDGATWFRFATPVTQLSVIDANGRSNGTQKDAYYRFDGVSSHFTVTADGATVEVTRQNVNRFSDQVTS